MTNAEFYEALAGLSPDDAAVVMRREIAQGADPFAAWYHVIWAVDLAGADVHGVVSDWGCLALELFECLPADKKALQPVILDQLNALRKAARAVTVTSPRRGRFLAAMADLAERTAAPEYWRAIVASMS